MRIGASANPYQQHQAAFQADFVARVARPAQARVTTRDIGISIGGFGLRWQSQDVQIDTEASDRLAAERTSARQSRDFCEEMDVAEVRGRLGGAALTSDLQDGLSATDNPAADAQAGASTFAYAFAAYARVQNLAQAEPLPGRVLGVA